MVSIGLIRTRREIGIVAIIAAVAILAAGWYFGMSWFDSLQGFLNDHGGWTYAYLIGIAFASSFVAYVHRHPYTAMLALITIIAVVGAALAGNVIGA